MTEFYRGPSMLDGKPIVAIATRGTKNRKTGDMIQTWILRADVDPLTALRDGKDASICGTCYHRGDKATGRPRTCYVTVAQAPLQIWRSWKAGKYPKGPLPADKPVRMGAYGDPVAVPWRVWADRIHEAPGWTGYTHQWRTLLAHPFRNLLMASCDSTLEMAEAARSGWRSFVVSNDGMPAEAVEGRGAVECPSSRGAACADCQLCSGLQHANAPNIFIAPHGTAARFVGAT